jgi:hypothetical protein
VGPASQYRPAAVEDFRVKAQTGATAVLGNLISVAPFCGIKAIALGCRELGSRERAALFQLLMLAVVPENVRSELGSIPAHRTLAEAEDKLLVDSF